MKLSFVSVFFSLVDNIRGIVNNGSKLGEEIAQKKFECLIKVQRKLSDEKRTTVQSPGEAGCFNGTLMVRILEAKNLSHTSPKNLPYCIVEFDQNETTCFSTGISNKRVMFNSRVNL